METRLNDALRAYALQHGFMLGEDAARYVATRAAANIRRTAFNDQQRDEALRAAIRALPELERAITRRTANREFLAANAVLALRNGCEDVPYPWNVCE